jgi:hypothetical protein
MAAIIATTEAARRAKNAVEDARLTRIEEKLEPKVTPPSASVDMAKLKQADYAAGEAWERERDARVAAQQTGGEGTFIGPMFSDRNADFNGSLSSELIIGRAPFSFDSGSPADPKVDLGGDSTAVWAFGLIGLLIRYIAAPIANAMALKRRTPNVTVQLYYSLYGESGVRVPGIIVDNQSKEPIWVNRVVLNNAGTRTVQIPSRDGTQMSPGFLPPVVQPGSSEILYLQPAETNSVFPISPHIGVTVHLTALEVSQGVEFQVSSAGAMGLETPP